MLLHFHTEKLEGFLHLLMWNPRGEKTLLFYFALTIWGQSYNHHKVYFDEVY